MKRSDRRQSKVTHPEPVDNNYVAMASGQSCDSLDTIGSNVAISQTGAQSDVNADPAIQIVQPYEIVSVNMGGTQPQPNVTLPSAPPEISKQLDNGVAQDRDEDNSSLDVETGL